MFFGLFMVLSTPVNGRNSRYYGAQTYRHLEDLDEVDLASYDDSV